MNYYSFHIGDYAAHTRHLSLMEDLAYRRLLDLYYLREGNLPLNCARLIGMQEHEEAVKAVLVDFFELGEDGWHHKRCDEELAKFQSNKDTARRAGQASAKQRALNGRSTGVEPPLNEPSTGVEQALNDRSTNQEPITKNQEPEEIAPSELVGTVVADPWRPPPCPHEEIVRLYGELLPQLPRCLALNDSRRSHIGARWRQVCCEERFSRAEGLEWFADFFRRVSKSKFLTGNAPSKDGRVWRADLDWLMNSTNFLKTFEGRYHAEAA
jgi:uncharacterized protein YdaU (DUF1376 family)